MEKIKMFESRTLDDTITRRLCESSGLFLPGTNGSFTVGETRTCVTYTNHLSDSVKIGVCQKVRFFFELRRTWNQETMAAPRFAWNDLAGLSEPSRQERRAAIGRGRIKPTVKLRLPRGKARQIAWMSTIPGNHDETESLHISDGIGARNEKCLVSLCQFDHFVLVLSR